jgi:hypothetical protein
MNVDDEQEKTDAEESESVIKMKRFTAIAKNVKTVIIAKDLVFLQVLLQN